MRNTSKWRKKDTLSLQGAAKKLCIKTEVLRLLIDKNNIELRENRIHYADVDLIYGQKLKYISLIDYIRKQDGPRFESRLVKHRNKLIDFLEDNDYFGVNLHDPDELIFTSPESEEYYISIKDIVHLDRNCQKFLADYGYSEEQKVWRLLSNTRINKLLKKHIKGFLKAIDDGCEKYTPSMTRFIEVVLDGGDPCDLNDQDIVCMIDILETKSSKELLTKFFNYVSQHEEVEYHPIKLEKKENQPVIAYSYEEFISLARVLFNDKYSDDMGLTLKALENHMNAETWLFLSIHYVCGWRASDICDNWIYPNLKDNNKIFKIDIVSLKDDILNNQIDKELYEKVALYCVKKIEMSSMYPSKTPVPSAGKLRSEIVPDLRIFFGKLILIAEYHMWFSKDGYLKANRIKRYCNWVYLKEFFGEGMYEFTGKNNIATRRLNKSYLQGIEQAARDSGSTTLQAHIVASYARNHSNIDTTLVYLRDHGLTGESAEVVLYMMMQRGVFGVSLYYALLPAYPEMFSKLSAKDQTRLMNKLSVSAYELESLGSVMIANERLSEEMGQGKTNEAVKILKAMYAVGQGQGRSKDQGVFCKRKALGESCTHPLYQSCIANLCEHHIFTNDGIPSLIKVIKEYQRKVSKTANIKYEVALKTKVIPAFQTIIKEIIKDMSGEEKERIKMLIQERQNE